MIAVTSDFHAVVMDVVDPAVAEAERNPPRLGADGQIEFDPAYHRVLLKLSGEVFGGGRWACVSGCLHGWARARTADEGFRRAP